jgi:hypothetical protein
MGYIAVAQGVKVRASILTAVTRKAIFMSEVTSEQTADIVNFVSSDIRKIYDGMQVCSLKLRSRVCCHQGRGLRT